MLNRLLRRLSGRHEDDLAQLTRAVRALAATQRDQMAAITGRLAALSEMVAQRSTARDANEILQGVRAATVLIGKGPAEGADAHARLYQSLDALAKGAGPIIVGPWTGEVGFELLYWIPFVQWFRARWRVAAERLVIVSRGGTEAWYGTPGARYVDIFSLMPPDSFRARTDPHEHKQREVSPLDEEIVGAIRRQIAVDDAALLHPRLMYRLFAPYWRDEAGFGLIDRFTSHRRIGRGDDPIVEGLPDDYVAARFYFSDCFPDTPTGRSRPASSATSPARCRWCCSIRASASTTTRTRSAQRRRLFRPRIFPRRTSSASPIG